MKKLLKILVWIAGVLLVLLILLAIGLKLFFPVEKAKAMAVERGAKMLGRPIGVEDVDVSLWGGLGIVLKDVTIGSPVEMEVGDLLSAEAVDLKLQILPLLSGRYRIDKLVIDNPRIVMVKNADGANNYTFTFPEKTAPRVPTDQLTPETKAAAAAVSFEQFEINGGSLDYIDDSSQIRVYLKGLDLSTALKNPRQGFYESSGKVSVDSLLIITEKPLPSLSIDLRYQADYDVAGRRLSLKEAELAVNKLVFSITAELAHGGDSFKARAGIKSKTISVEDLFSLLPADQLAELKDFSISGDFSLDVDLEYDDSRKEPVSYAGTAIISDMTMSKKDLAGELHLRQALVDFKPDNVRVNIEEGTFDGQPLKGHLVVDNFDDPLVNGALSGRCDLAYIKPFLPAEGKHELAGEVDFDVKVSGRVKDAKNMSFSGSLVISEGHYNSELLPEPIESFSLDVYFDNTVTRINQLSGKMPSGHMDLSGRITNLVPYLMADTSEAKKVTLPIDGHVDGQFDLASFSSFLPPAGNPELKGSIAINLDVTGDAADITTLKPRGKLSITNASFTDSLLPESIQSFEATMQVGPDTIVIDDMTVQFESSDVSFSGKLIHPFPYLLPIESVSRSKAEKPRFLFKLNSHRFDIDRLFPEAVPGSGTNRAALPVDSVPPIILPDINGQGTFQIDTVVYSQVEFTHLTGKVRIRERKIDCYDVTGKVYSGDIGGGTTIDLSDFDNPRYSGEFKATQIEADDFVTRFTKFGGHLFGKTNFSGSYEARGWEPDEFLNSLTMNAKADMHDGKMVTSEFLSSAIAGLAKLAGQSFEREQPLKALSTNVVVRDGKVSLDKLKTRVGNVGDLELGGFYAFDGEIGYKGSLLLSKEWTAKLMSQGGLLGGLAGLFANGSVERIKLPLAIGGTIDKPAVNIDYSALSKNVQDNLTKDAGDLLKGLFKKKDKK